MRNALIALALLAGCSTPVQEMTLLDRYVWTHPDPAFGGLSGFEISRDGNGLTAVSDRGDIWRGRITRQGDQITGVDQVARFRLKQPNGRDIFGLAGDSEGLAIAVDGTAFVSFEGIARVWAYPDLTAPARALPILAAFEMMQGNAALEALAVDANGAVYTMPERSGAAQRPFPVYRFDGGTWDTAFEISRLGKFLPVGLDFGPDGRFYLLERDFTGIGFRSRIRRFDADGGSAEILLETRNGDFDNLEGISVWEDPAGALRLTLVSDDNFKFFQQTEIVEFRLTR